MCTFKKHIILYLLLSPALLFAGGDSLYVPPVIEIPGYEEPFTSSALPIVIIDTHGQEIPKVNPRIIADMGIINNDGDSVNVLTDPINGYRGKISIERRGESSAGWKKKQYDIETIDENGNNNNVSLLGFPAENDWILNAPYIDKSFMRNALIFYLANKMGRYASRTRYFELVLNGEYQGIYVLLEKIKRDRNRVDIATLTMDDNKGDELTGGYILRIDKMEKDYVQNIDYFTSVYFQHPDFNENTNYQFRYPESDIITTEQKEYIKNFIYKFEDVMASDGYADPDTGYAKYLDVGSCIDFFILNELAKNVDGYRLSTYMYKDKHSNGGKLKIGPIWDFNLAFGLANYYDGDDTDDWMVEGLSDPKKMGKKDQMAQFWWLKLFREEKFSQRLNSRWQELRQSVLHIENIYGVIDSIAVTLDEAKDRNFAIWTAPGESGDGFWPVPKIFHSFETYQDEVDYLKQWTTARIQWIDQNIKAATGMKDNNTIRIRNFELHSNYPNPFNTSTAFQYYLPEAAYVLLNIYDIHGRRVRQLVKTANMPGFQRITWDGLTDTEGTAASGVYIYEFTARSAKHNYTQTGKMTLIR